ncbi:hypothetical protein P9272_34405 [Mesorhizobium sp. WSM4976]|uniref:hypothetical protein n=1 Tax=Mesorhizobium sp. WSM4976 TaxID=3038549 RepID=UPI002417FEA1|nr:hypothetical protein [Mesorhizobium sp. WSM4976]MDG4898612.1 hypothetical protein [Mesorhizobium sp. WSM4976]
MSTRDPFPPQSEPTPEGEQTLVPGVRPIATRDRLSLLMDAPMRPRAPQKPPEIGLFDGEADQRKIQ